MIRVVCLGFALITAATAQASTIQTCSSSEAEQAKFLHSRMEPMAKTKPLAASEEWVLVIARNYEGSALKLRDFCKAHPRVPLAVAFQSLFNGD